MKQKLDAWLRELQTETNALKRTTELIAIANSYLRLGYFLDCGKVLKEADNSVNGIKDKAKKDELMTQINKVNKRRGNTFLNRTHTGDDHLPAQIQ